MRLGGAPRFLMISVSSKSRSSISPSEGSDSLSDTSSIRGLDILVLMLVVRSQRCWVDVGEA